MNTEFISLCKLGVGTVLIRHSEIISLEPTALGYTKITISTGEHLIVEDGPLKILQIINNLENLKEQTENLSNNS